MDRNSALSDNHLQDIKNILIQLSEMETITGTKVRDFYYTLNKGKNDEKRIKISFYKPKEPMGYTYIENIDGKDIYITFPDPLHAKQEQFEDLNLDFSEASVIDSMLSEGIISKKRYEDIITRVKDSPKRQYDEHDPDDMYTKKEKTERGIENKETTETETEKKEQKQPKKKMTKEEKAGIGKIETNKNSSKISIDHIKLAKFRLLDTNLELIALTILIIFTALAFIENISQNYIIISIIFLLYAYVLSRIIRKAINLFRAKNSTDPTETKKIVKDILMDS